MAKSSPTVYIFHGEDEFGIAAAVADLKAKLAGEHPVDLDISILESGSYSLADLQAIVLTIPFFAKRRLVVLKSLLKQFSEGGTRGKFQSLLDGIPESTALVISETSSLDKKHWLLAWSSGRPGKTYAREYSLQAGRDLSGWIRQQAQEQGGELTPKAAGALADLAGSNKRHAAQEVAKLLAYTGYQRAVEVEDVNLLSTRVDDETPSLVFEMVDRIGKVQPKELLDSLHALLQVHEPSYLFYMVVRQFRLLLLAREGLDTGLRGNELASQMKVKPWVANKVQEQARSFDLATLLEIYHRLLNLDTEIKTGQSDYTLALDILLASLTPRPAAR